MDVFKVSACILVASLGGCASQFNMKLSQSSHVSVRPDSTIGPSIFNRKDSSWMQYDFQTDGKLIAYLQKKDSTMRADITDCADHSFAVDEFYVAGKSLDQVRSTRSVWFGYRRGQPITMQLYVNSRDLDSNTSVCVIGRGGTMTGSSFSTNKIRLK